jgi:hypothetical protein
VTESCEFRRIGARLLAPAGVCLALVCAVALVAAPARASSLPQPRVAPKGPLPIPGAFRLSASSGYTLYVSSVPPRAGRSGFLIIFAFATKGRGVRYVAPATVTETSMQSDLGELGEISVSFNRTNRATSIPCGGEAIHFDSGRYEGKIDFHGEEGYTNVEATAAPGGIDFFLSTLCGESFIEGSSDEGARGAELYVRNPGLGPELSVSKRRPGAAALITASMREYKDGISIERFMGLWMPGEAFKYDRRLRTATVRPPAPFFGSARFDLGKKAGRRWSGDLTVDLPGKSGVPLTGPTLRAALSPR